MSREIYERGTILDTMRRNRGLEIPISFLHLLSALDLLNLPLSPQRLREYLEYLSEKGYLELKRRRDLPGFRFGGLKTNEQPDHIITARLTARAIDLLDGTISDPSIFT